MFVVSIPQKLSTSFSWEINFLPSKKKTISKVFVFPKHCIHISPLWIQPNTDRTQWNLWKKRLNRGFPFLSWQLKVNNNYKRKVTCLFPFHYHLAKFFPASKSTSFKIKLRSIKKKNNKKRRNKDEDSEMFMTVLLIEILMCTSVGGTWIQINHWHHSWVFDKIWAGTQGDELKEYRNKCMDS